MWLYTFYIVFTHVFGAPEVITLIRDRNVTCITTGDSRYSPIYIAWTNMTQKFNGTRTVNEFKDWINDDWINTNNTQFSFEPVIDIRWEQFKDGRKGIKHNAGITIFSVCSLESNPINFHIPQSNGNCNYNFTFNKMKICEHYILNVTQSKSTIRSQGQMAHETNCSTNFFDIIIHNASNALSRIHKYEFKYSSVTTNDNTGSSVSVESSDSSCISMFISIDKGCYLNITIANKNETSVQRYEGFNDENALKRWKRIEIKSKYKVGNVSFIRGREDGTNEGFWAIDFIHSCRPDPDYVTFEVPTPVDVLNNFTCKVLNDTSSTNAYNRSCENPENIGKDCVDCQKVLGQSNLQCDYQKICVENSCHCGVGYQGQFCNQSCEPNRWGLNCEQKCPRHCDHCNAKIGCSCARKYFGNECYKLFPILTRAPILKSITNISLTIFSDMEYVTKDEESPEYYQIQYRKDNDKTFMNFSTLKPYAKPVEIVISEVTPNQNSYEIRIILLIRNEATEEDAPKLTTYKKSLTANFVDSYNIMLTWNSSNNTDKEYFLNYTCHLKLCSFENTTVGNFTTNETKAELKVENFNYCNVNLYLKKPSDVNFLLDQIQITAPNIARTINETELPKNIILSDNKIILEFETCDRFRGPLNFSLEFRCLNESCLKENFTIKDISFNSYTNKTELSYNFEPSIHYNITVTAFRSTIYLKRYFIKQTPSGNISMVHENYIYILLGVTAILMLISLTTAFICCKCNRFKTTQREREPPENLELIPAIIKNVTKRPRKKNYIVYDYVVEADHFEEYLKTTFKHEPKVNTISEQLKRPSGQTNGSVSEDNYNDEILIQNKKRNVILSKSSGEEIFINAYYVEGYQAPNAFIVTEIPLQPAISDFWQMICQENVSTIIMLTELQKNEKCNDCEQYWPDAHSICRFGEYLIEDVGTEKFDDYVHRSLEVHFKNKTHCVEQFQYVRWPQDGVPLEVEPFCLFIKRMLQIPDKHYPIVIHSSGFGGIGAIILCDIMLRMVIQEGIVDFRKVVPGVINQIPGGMQNIEEYKFAHYVIHRCLFNQNYEIIVDKNFIRNVQQLINPIEINLLKFQVVTSTKEYQENIEFKYNVKLTDEEMSKNRFPDLLPEYCQVFLPNSKRTSNYINAVRVDCCSFPRKFLVTQQPLPNTITDFWKMIVGYKIETIISLNDIFESDPDCPRFWPNRKQQIWPFNDFVLTFVNEKVGTTYDLVHGKIVDNNEQNSMEVNIIILKNWKRNTLSPSKIEDIIQIWNNFAMHDKQVVVTCYDGVTASGFFVAMAHTLEQMRLQKICDVFSAVKIVKQSRSQFLASFEQFEFLYKAAIAYAEMIETESDE